MPKFSIEMIYETIEFFEVEAETEEEAIDMVSTGIVNVNDTESSFQEIFVEEISDD